MKKTLNKVLLLLALLTVFLSACGANEDGDIPDSSEPVITATPTPAPTQEPTAAPTPAPSVPAFSSTADGTYFNGKYGFSMKYDNAAWAVTDTELFGDENAKTEFMASSGMAEDMVIQQLELASCIFTYKLPEAAGLKSNINIVVTPGIGSSLDELGNSASIEQMETSLSSMFGEMGYDVEFSEETSMRTFGETEYLLLQMDYSTVGIELRLYQATTIVDGNSISISFTSGPGSFDELKAGVDEMIASLTY